MEALGTMTLDGFVGHWLKDAPICPPAVPYERVASNIGVTLYRDDRFQVQLWTFAPHSEIADHSHPDVDSWVVWVGGDYCFRKNGRMVERPDMKFVRWRGVTVPKLHLAPGDMHGASIGPTGGSFLSITERLDGHEPVSVHLVWAGPPLDSEHDATLRGEPDV